MKNKYYEIIKENIINIKKNQIFPSEAKLLLALGIKEKLTTNSLISVRKALNCFIEYSVIEEKKRAVRVTKKYRKPKFIEELEIKEFQEMSEILKHLVSKQQIKEENSMLICSKMKLCETMGCFNTNFKVALFNKKEFMDYLQIDHNAQEVLYKVILFSYNKAKAKIIQNLKRLQNMSYLLYNESEFMYVCNNNHFLATIEEKKKIINAERTILDTMGKTSKNEVFFVWEEFQRRVVEYLKEHSDFHIDRYYGVITIIAGERFTQSLLGKINFRKTQSTVNEEIMAINYEKLNELLSKTHKQQKFGRDKEEMTEKDLIILDEGIHLLFNLYQNKQLNIVCENEKKKIIEL